MGKRKESFFERLTRKNAEHENKNHEPSTKKKKWKGILIGTLLTGAIATGITVPVAVNSSKTKYKYALSEDSAVLTFKLPGSTVEHKITIKDLQNANKKEDAKDPKKILEQVRRLGMFYLYDKEVKASAEYQRLWNMSREGNEEETNSFKLKTVDELRTRERNKILDIQENFKKQAGYNKWEEEFNKILVSNYNGAKNIEEAVDFQIFKSIEKDALRRFELSTVDIGKIANRKANQKIYELDNEGNPDTSKVLFNVGEKVFKYYEENKNYFKVNDEYMSFTTNSYDFSKKYKDASTFIDEYYKNDIPYVFTQFTIPGVAPTKLAKKGEKEPEWTIDRTALRKLLYFYPADEKNKQTQSYEKIFSDFKSYSHYSKIIKDATDTTNLPQEVVDYTTFLSWIAADDDEYKNNFGTKGILSLSDILKSNNDEVIKGLIAIPDLIYNKKNYVGAAANALQIPELDLKDMFKQIQDTLEKEFNDLKTAKASYDESTPIDNKRKKVGDYNKKLIEIFRDFDNTKKTGLYDDKLKELITPIISKAFEDNDKKIRTFWKVKGMNNAYIYLNSKGITIVYAESLSAKRWSKCPQEENRKKMLELLKNDFILSKKYKSISTTKYNALSVISKNLKSDYYVNNVLLNDADFVKYLKEQNNIYALDSNGKLLKDTKYTEKDIEELEKLNSGKYLIDAEQKALDVNEKLTTWIKTRAKNEKDKDLEIKDGHKVYFANNNNSYADEVSKVIYEKLKTILKVFN
ncbi:hypothetical protein NPA07_01370 [Mycoplasmopsis caviae]|uniref:Membrane protein P80 n=1 Tax=Mycoplasmopsis caviae TaxID=55603 RepID=A0A3P8KLT3_9BACT|nr:hypothetical protein [Mycoplasmopsis caviae]UUD35506.1 hypothetical protein NPA07_01370 [Mycoplasmopsis caviae]VDR41718.1 Uncharacterised protein [Mycoplasmopsis caviae]